ncbi:hypothetical protein [Streptomyces sp. PSKA30]|uniref:hypothetical protein n=1 Tax=Streptomyces sp. PSKA30 TaxID=2874597 RepID=UPI001CD155A4|nr:hypothetical protein [Streptomyces sp. PSKA30]MBZ9642906.1 hypothetical protein [Streptomyces sp. PSKA30]
MPALDQRMVDRLFPGLSERATPAERMTQPVAAQLLPDGEELTDGRLGGRTAPARLHPYAQDRPPALAGPVTAAHNRLGDRLHRRPTT